MKLKLSSEEKKTGNVKNEAQIKKLFRKLTRGLMDIYVLFYLCIFPLCMRDKYFDILTFRFELFWKPTFVYGIIFVILGLLYLISDALYNGGAIRRRFLTGLKEVREKGNSNGFFGRVKSICRYLHISIVDIAITVLIILFAISTALAEYPYEAFWGDRGRNQGLLIWMMFYLAYILISRFYRYKKWHIYAYMLFSSIVCVWGILNFFLITFGMFENADDIFKYTFASSIGNINTYTNFTAMLYGVTVAVFISSEKIIETIFAFAVLLIASFAQIMGVSDNVVLSTGIVLAMAPVVLWKNKQSIIKYVVVCLTYLSALKITSCIVKTGIKTMNKTKESVQISLAGTGFMSILIALFAIILVVLVLTEFKSLSRKKAETVMDDDTGRIKTLRHIWLIFVTLGVCAVVVVLYLANTGWHEEIWKPFSNAIIINDEWGTGRGLNWRLGMEYWKNDATLLQKLFGYGPDTYYIITMDRFMNIMQDAGYGMFDSAHNEYFEYFITVGILGLAAYLVFLFTALKRMITSINTASKYMAMGVLGYAFQAVINIAVPITTPIFMILLFIGITVSKDEKAYC
ncbi:O-antigen ligase family protein [Oribacterium sp. P6A1]|uniref:O-antigen ligase family protein n=1 Tax=Oribacterium sp. P6A1 TaxID=1410612 RepID=UPI00056D8A6C|nr:O-antigen ligase family protein [Oribacterium sp. P6A1]